jgi:phage terminase small subunit
LINAFSLNLEMAKRKPNTLTPKEKAFVAEYLIDLNASAAAGRAGYKGRNLDVQGAKILAQPLVAEAIKVAIDQRIERTEIKADDVLRRLSDRADMDPAQFYDEKGRFLSIHDIPPEVRKCIRSMETFEEYEGTGKDRVAVGIVRKVSWWEKNKADELLGKHLKLWTDRIEVEAHEGRADRLARARARALEQKKGRK